MSQENFQVETYIGTQHDWPLSLQCIWTHNLMKQEYTQVTHIGKQTHLILLLFKSKADYFDIHNTTLLFVILFQELLFYLNFFFIKFWTFHLCSKKDTIYSIVNFKCSECSPSDFLFAILYICVCIFAYVLGSFLEYKHCMLKF